MEDRDKTKEQLTASSLRTILDSVNDAIFIHTIHGEVIDVNNKMLDIYQVSREEALSMNITEDFSSPDNPLDTIPELWESAIRGEKRVFEWKARRPHDNSIFYVEVFLKKINLTDGDAILATVHDITESKKAERALRESETKYRSIFENAVEGIFQSTPDGRFLNVNHALAAMCGYASPEEMITHITDIGRQHYVDPEKRIEFRQTIEERGYVENFEHKIRRKDGSTIWVLINARAVRDEDGKALYYEGTHEDITERKHTQEKLYESEKRFQDILQFFPDPTLVIDREGRVTAWNLALEELTGVKGEEMLGKGDYEYALPFYGHRRPILIDLVNEPAETIEQSYAHIQRHGNTLSGEAYMPNLSGGKVFLYGTATALRNKRGEIVGAIESIRDITERKLAETRLLESEERYRTAIENSNDGVAIVMGNRHAYVNHKFLEIFGYDDPSEIVGNTTFMIIHPDDRDMVIEYTRKRQHSEPVPSRYEFKGMKKDGTVVFIEASVAATAYGGESASLAYLRDITERNEMEERLRTMSIVDELTGLYNRRGFITLSLKHLKLADRTKKGMNLFFIDLDQMKWINDTMGHQEGDKALIGVATILKKTFRESDIIGRMGGDEFAVLATDAQDGTGETLRKRLKDSIETYNRQEALKHQISMSIGIAHFDPKHPSSLDELMAQADILMYEEKRNKQR
ncbi:MAG: hypothetical protein C0392_08480 [Syntrophus sp. (in: bacteria)]|nr:hypothetical protein [Syntrophus sp. (in: bacteria)]